ncbi:MAG: FG-GAP repeat domain-containing protein, partial [Planctomycetaceae bacterium]
MNCLLRGIVVLALPVLLLSCGTPVAERPNDPGAPQRGIDWFAEATETAGIEFVHSAGEPASYEMPAIMGSGAALFDFDADGDLDTYLVNGGTEQSSSTVRDQLLRQEDDGRFIDATAPAGLHDSGYGMGAAVGDIDNDGFPELFVTNYGQNRLWK